MQTIITKCLHVMVVALWCVLLAGHGVWHQASAATNTDFVCTVSEAVSGTDAFLTGGAIHQLVTSYGWNAKQNVPEEPTIFLAKVACPMTEPFWLTKTTCEVRRVPKDIQVPRDLTSGSISVGQLDALLKQGPLYTTQETDPRGVEVNCGGNPLYVASREPLPQDQDEEGYRSRLRQRMRGMFRARQERRQEIEEEEKLDKEREERERKAILEKQLQLEKRKAKVMRRDRKEEREMNRRMMEHHRQQQLQKAKPFEKFAARRWPNNTIPVSFSPDYPTSLRRKVHWVMSVLNQQSCVQFTKATDPNQYSLRIVKDKKECSSSVGYRQYPDGFQTANLHDNCFFDRGSIFHELLHAAGINHQHVRPDRDTYVTIHSENIREKTLFNFRKRTGKHDHLMTFGLPYDYNSVMHYGAKAFAKDIKKPTISVNKDFPGLLGQRTAPSRGDVAILNRYYQCEAHYLGDDIYTAIPYEEFHAGFMAEIPRKSDRLIEWDKRMRSSITTTTT
ncbi:uncharacterized protein [Panulirus ornatus]|uniref:uncharacterized protein n=1 Tax=Panulirus ornatus TaxID=150431 RepID=UPI003A86E154